MTEIEMKAKIQELESRVDVLEIVKKRYQIDNIRMNRKLKNIRKILKGNPKHQDLYTLLFADRFEREKINYNIF